MSETFKDGDMRIYCLQCKKPMMICKDGGQWSNKAYNDDEHTVEHDVVGQMFHDGKWLLLMDEGPHQCYNQIYKELPDALRGVISMIENQQYSLAITHLQKHIKELEEI